MWLKRCGHIYPSCLLMWIRVNCTYYRVCVRACVCVAACVSGRVCVHIYECVYLYAHVFMVLRRGAMVSELVRLNLLSIRVSSNLTPYFRPCATCKYFVSAPTPLSNVTQGQIYIGLMSIRFKNCWRPLGASRFREDSSNDPRTRLMERYCLVGGHLEF